MLRALPSTLHWCIGLTLAGGTEAFTIDLHRCIGLTLAGGIDAFTIDIHRCIGLTFGSWYFSLYHRLYTGVLVLL